jgi:hypothetical protein
MASHHTSRHNVDNISYRRRLAGCHAPSTKKIKLTIDINKTAVIILMMTAVLVCIRPWKLKASGISCCGQVFQVGLYIKPELNCTGY